MGQRQRIQKFDEIIKMVDDMVVLLTKENAEDEKQKGWCEDEFAKSADEEAGAKTRLGQIEAEISELGDEISELSEAINTLTSEIAELDKTVADATEDRKADHAAFTESLQLSEGA